MKTDSDTGVLYVATGAAYLREAHWAARSARRHGLRTALFCDDPGAVETGRFDYVRKIDDPEYGLIDKIAPLRETPFERTLFLDTDTFVQSDVTDVFSILDAFDLAYAHAPIRRHVAADFEEVPRAFVQPNTGVILYRKGPKIETLVAEWMRIYRAHLRDLSPPPNDQPAFKKAVFDSKLRPYILPPAYNLRVDKTCFVGGNMTAKILHARPEIIERMRPHFRTEAGPMPEITFGEDEKLLRRVGLRALVRASAKGLYRWVAHRLSR